MANTLATIAAIKKQADKKQTVHYANRDVQWFCGWFRACDWAWRTRQRTAHSIRATTNKSRVTCGNCKRTKAYRRKK